MKYLVLGGAGYVGSHFIREALRNHDECVVYDNLSRGFREAIPSEVRLVEGDLLDTDLLVKTIEAESPDAILHYAAFALVGESVQQPELYERNNVQGTASVLAALVRTSPEIPIVFSSTCAIYGVPETLPMKESLPKQPISPYGETKLRCEQLFKEFVETHPRARATCLRYFNACGADASGVIGEAHEPETHLIPNILLAAMANKPVHIFGDDFPTRDGSCIRDYIHVTDLATVHRTAAQMMAEQSDYGFRAYNLGTGRGTSNLEIVEMVRKVTGRNIDVKIGPRRDGDPAELYADPSLAQSELGFDPQHSSLETIIASAWQWHQSHPRGFH